MVSVSVSVRIEPAASCFVLTTKPLPSKKERIFLNWIPASECWFPMSRRLVQRNGEPKECFRQGVLVLTLWAVYQYNGTAQQSHPMLALS